MRNISKVQLLAGAVLISGLIAVVALRYAEEAAAPLYAGIHGVAGVVPGLDIVADGGLIVASLLFGWAAWQSRGPDLRPLAALLAGGVGVVVAYVGSELLKLVVAQDRPCRTVAEAAVWVNECPPVGDWSYPSNHATIGFAVSAALAAVRSRLALAALPLAAVISFARVAGGVHYPHDVVAGAVLAAAVVTPAVLLLDGQVHRLLWWTCERFPFGDRLLRSAGRAEEEPAEGEPAEDGAAGEDRTGANPA